MSLLTTLAYAITAAIRPKVREVDLAWMQSQIDDLNRKADNLLADITRQRDDWQTLALSYRREVMERRGLPLGQHFIGEETHLRAQAQAQAQAQQQISGMWGLQQTQQNQYSMLQNSPMIGQNFAQALDNFVCNCVPARHDAFKGVMNSD